MLYNLLSLFVLVSHTFAMQAGAKGGRFKPCNNDVVLMDAINGRQKHWIGIIDLNNLPFLDVYNINLYLSAYSQVTLIEPSGLLSGFGDTFNLSYRNIRNQYDKIRFSVAGALSNPIPSVTGLVINSMNYCPNPTQLISSPTTRKMQNKPPKQRKPPRNNRPKPGGNQQQKRPANGGGGQRKPPSSNNTPAINYPPQAVYPNQNANNYGQQNYYAQTGQGTYNPNQQTYYNQPVVQRTSTCGNKYIRHQGLITNGYPSQEGEWPWHAAIFHHSTATNVEYKCGGTLIAADAVLTAAHCLIENGRFVVPSRVVIKAGQHNRFVAGRNTQELQVYKIIPHELFSFDDLRNDIAVLRLRNAVTFTNYVQAICLWPRQRSSLEEVINKYGFVVGWGLTEQDSLSDILTQGQMPVVSTSECLNSNRDSFGTFLTDTNYCAGFRNGTSVCNGDSGGGMFFQIGNFWHIRGIVSLSTIRKDKEVCNPKQYVIFTDTAKYTTWIERNMQ